MATSPKDKSASGDENAQDAAKPARDGDPAAAEPAHDGDPAAAEPARDGDPAAAEPARDGDPAAAEPAHDGDPAAAEPPKNDQPLNGNQIFEKIIQEILSEIYLLLDYISGQPDKHISDLDGKILHENEKNTSEKRYYTGSELINTVSLIQFPPPDRKATAADASFLLNVRDVLNTFAFPAKGLSIAFTTFVADERSARELSSQKTSSRLRNCLVSKIFGCPSAERDAHRTGDLNKKRGTEGRLRAAETTFGHLRASAQRLAWLLSLWFRITLFLSIVSTILLCHVTYGVNLAGRFDKAKSDETSAAVKVFDEMDRSREKEPGLTNDINWLCRIDPAFPLRDDTRNSKIQQLCSDYAYRHAVLCVTISDLGVYSSGWTGFLFKFYTIFLPSHQLKPNDYCAPSTNQSGGIDGDTREAGFGRQEDAKSIFGILEIMTNNVLPVLFSFLGTMAALIRDIQNKIAKSTITPRDSALAVIRIPLGVVAGVCVGLFLSPTILSDHPPANLGSFTLTASGLAFLAGYGAEGFFVAIDTLISRVFNAGDDSHVVARR